MKRVIGDGRPRPVRRFALLVPVALLLDAMASMPLGAVAGLAIPGEEPTLAQWAGIAAAILASLGTTLSEKGDPKAITAN